MEYLNAKDILPDDLLKQVQIYASGQCLYIPQRQENTKSWGEVSGYRSQLQKRNRMIINKFEHGIRIETLSNEYCLSEETIKKIVYSKKITQELHFYPTVESAKEYDEQGLLEEWIHTYLLFFRKNKAFSDGLYKEERYYIGPIMMPLSLFQRNCGPEEEMKWHVNKESFEEKVRLWIHKIENKENLPPLIIGYADDRFEINCNSPLFEALIRLNKEMFVIIIWITSQKDYKSFKQNYMLPDR